MIAMCKIHGLRRFRKDDARVVWACPADDCEAFISQELAAKMQALEDVL